jgi:DNA-binding IclR family transcriptional regulator
MDYTVDAVDKAIGLLLLVAQFPDLGVTELAKRSGNTKARSFRLLGTLESNGLVKRDANAAYRLGHRVLYLGASATEQLDIVRLSGAVFKQVHECCDENVFLRIRDGLETVCVAGMDSSHDVRLYVQIGARRPLYLGASGKLLLAHAGPDVLEQVVAAGMTKYTENTLTSKRALEKELKTILAAGFSVSFGERNFDTVAVAAPVRDSSGHVIAALSIAGPASRINEKNLDVFINCVKQNAKSFSKELGYSE